MSCEDIDNVISLRESGAGLTPSDSQAGRTTDPSGRAVARASRSQSRGKGRDSMTSGTCGPLFSRSSPSAALQRSLESRLRRNLDVNGSPEYALTWKEWDMQSGLPICALRASARRTSGSASTGWRTPADQEAGITVDRLVDENGNPWTPGHRAYDKETGRLCQTGLMQQAQAVGWRTPNASDGEGGPLEPRQGCSAKLKLRDHAHWTAGWPTPDASGIETLDPERILERRARCKERLKNGNGFGLNLANAAVVLTPEPASGWPTPRAEDSEQTGGHRGKPDTLDSASKLAGWPTPCAQDQDHGHGGTWTTTQCNLHNVVLGIGKQTTGEVIPASQAVPVGHPSLAGWPTPKKQNANAPSVHGTGGAELQLVAGWATPRSGKVTEEELETWQARHERGEVATMPLTLQAQMAGWSTPTSQDAKNNAGPSQWERHSEALNVQAQMAGWRTPCERDHHPSKIDGKNTRTDTQIQLAHQAEMAGWPTPDCTLAGDGQDWESLEESLQARRKRTQQAVAERKVLPGSGRSPNLVHAASGTQPPTSPAGTAKRGVLNPAFSLWLMGFPTAWAVCGAQVTPSSRKSRKRS